MRTLPRSSGRELPLPPDSTAPREVGRARLRATARFAAIVRRVQLSNNVTKIYAYRFLSDFLLLVPVILPFYKACSLTVTQFLVAQAVFSLATLALEIPSGYLADALGRKRALVLGATFFPVGIGLYAVSSSFVMFCVAEFLLAISVSMRSGTDSALVFDTLRQLGRDGEYRRIEGRARLFERLGTAVSSILGGLLALVSLRLPFAANAGTALLLVVVGLLLVEPARVERRSRTPLRDMLAISTQALKNRRVRLLSLFQALFACSGALGVWLAFVYYSALGLSTAVGGVLFFAFQLLAGLSSDRADAMEKALGSRRVIWLLLLTSPGFLLLGTWTSPWLLPAILVNAALWGVSTPLVLDRLNRLVESETRATVLSVSGMVTRVVLVVCYPLFGLIVDRVSLSGAYLALGVAVGLCGIPLAWSISREPRLEL